MALKTKNCGMRIRVEAELRDEFVDVCRKQDKPAAQIIREFMREYISNYRQSQQGSLFERHFADES